MYASTRTVTTAQPTQSARQQRRLHCRGEVSYAVTSSYTESEITVFKLDSTGTLVWERDYAAGVDAYFQSLALTFDGGAIVSGTVSTQTATTYTSRVLLLKLDSAGKTQSARTILTSGNISDLTIVGVQ